MADKIINAFAYVLPYIGWACLSIGVGMFLLTLVGIAAFGTGWKVFLASCAGWLVLAKEGFDVLAEEAD